MFNLWLSHVRDTNGSKQQPNRNLKRGAEERGLRRGFEKLRLLRNLECAPVEGCVRAQERADKAAAGPLADPDAEHEQEGGLTAESWAPRGRQGSACPQSPPPSLSRSSTQGCEWILQPAPGTSQQPSRAYRGHAGAR